MPVASETGPLYRRLAARLRGEIEAGWPGTDRALPPERDLAVRFGVSRETVRKALKLLETHGLLYGEQGRGTFVAPAAVRRMARFLDSFSQDTQARGDVAGQVILAVEPLPATLAIAGILGVAPSQTVTRVLRVRTINGAPVGIHDAYLNLPAGAVLTKAALERANSLYALLSERFGVTPAEGLESLGAVAAGPEDAAHLGVEPGDPLLLCERITLSERRQAIEYCLMRYVPTYRYTARINRADRLDGVA